MRATACALLAMAALACDPIMGVRAEVRSIPPSNSASRDAYTGAHPIKGAKLSLVCPDQEPRPLGSTDGAGELDFATVGLLDADCAIHAEAEGYHSDELSVGDLCVYRSGSSCHFMAAFVELVPISSTPVNVASPATAPTPPTTLRVTLTAPRVSVFVRKSSSDTSDLVAYDALGTAPVRALLPPGKYRVAASIGEREPVEAPEDVELRTPRRIELAYSDRSTLRTLKTASLIAGIVVGPTLVGIGSTQHGVAKGVLIGAGATVGIGGVVFAIDLAETKDELGVVVMPDR